MSHLLLIIAAFLFAIQFVFNQKFQQIRGEGIDATLLFQIYTAIVMVILMFVLNKFQIHITLFSLMVGILYAADIALYFYFSMKAFSTANLFVFSIFAMLGGMIVPFVYGIVFCNEGITFAKLVSCILITISLVMTYEKKEATKKSLYIYMAVFVFNGMMGVISKIHQSNTAFCTDSKSFMAITYAALLIISLIWFLLKNKKLEMIKPKEFCFTTCYSFCSGIAGILSLIALKVLQASVQYPIITGGTILFSAMINFIMARKYNKREGLSALIALAATCVIIL